MLKELYVSNLGVIEKSTMTFSSGFTAITGETGAGKTMLLNALSLIQGKNANYSLIRKGADKTTVTAFFDCQGVNAGESDGASDVSGRKVGGADVDTGAGAGEGADVDAGESGGASSFIEQINELGGESEDGEVEISRILSQTSTTSSPQPSQSRLDAPLSGKPSQSRPSTPPSGKPNQSATTAPSAGKSRSFAGGTPVTSKNLQNITDKMITIHGQLEQVRLLSKSNQLQLLDKYAESESLLSEYKLIYSKYQQLSAKKAEFKEKSKVGIERLEFIKDQLDKIDKVNPQVNEDNELRELAKKIDNFGLLSEKINEAEAVLFATNNSTNSESVSDMLQSAINSLSSVSSVDEKLTNIVDTLNNVFYTVDDLKEQLSSFIATLEYNPALFEKTHRRLDELATVTRLFDGTVEGVLEAKDTLSEEYDVIVNTDDRLAQLDAELDTTFKSMQKLASELSGLRKESAIKLAEKINEELEGLSMQSVEFAIDINSSDATFKPNGIDDVMFTISPYKNADFVPINKAASGGELSRIMLAIELVLHEKSKDASKTLVFDEVDSGLGGGVAKQVGMRLRRLAESVQVIVITHLPQVASFAQEQITLEKTQEENGAFAIAHNVYENERLSEIARMLSGSVNETSLNHAKELLTDSQKY